MLAKNSSPPTRQISNPGKVSVQRGDAGRRDRPRSPATGRASRLVGGWFDRSTSAATAPVESDALQDAQCQLSGDDNHRESKLPTVARQQVVQIFGLR